MPWFLLLLLFFSLHAIAIDNSCIANSNQDSIENNRWLPNKSVIVSGSKQVLDNHLIEISGNARLYTNNLHLSADNIIINKIDKTLQAIDNIHLTDQNIKFSPQFLKIKNLDSTASITLKEANFLWRNTRINGYANSVHNDGKKNNYTFDQITFSTCVANNPLWAISSKKMIVNPDKNFGIVYGATFKFMDIPVFYTPIYRWNLSGRVSGLLVPKVTSFSTSDNQSGLQIVQPYYFNVAPDKALILSANFLSDRGTGIKSHYRQLFVNADIDFKVDYLPNDSLLKTQRWLLETENIVKLSSNTILKLDINRVSDLSYFEDIEHKAFSEKSLKSVLKIQRETQKNDIYLALEDYQFIQGEDDFISEVKLRINTRNIISNGSFNTQSGLTNFTNDDSSKTQGIRLYNQLSYTKNSYQTINTFVSEVNSYFRYYDLNNQDNQTDTIFNVNIDSQWHFFRSIKWFGNKMRQSLTPRVFYNYTQDKDQNNLPNFDSELIIQNYNTLFSNRVYTGFDRIQAANNITLGLSSAFYDNSNEQYFDMGIAQTFYAKVQNNPYNTDKSQSNIVVNFAAQATQQKFDVDLVYKDSTQDLIEQHYFWSYQPSKRYKKSQTLNLSYHKTQDNNQTQEYGQINAASVVGRGFKVFAGIKYDITNKQTNQSNYGVTFKNCCLLFELSSTQSFNNLNNNLNNIISLKVNLLGFLLE